MVKVDKLANDGACHHANDHQHRPRRLQRAVHDDQHILHGTAHPEEENNNAAHHHERLFQIFFHKPTKCEAAQAAGYDKANVNDRAQTNHIFPFLDCESNTLFHHQYTNYIEINQFIMVYNQSMPLYGSR